MDQINRVVRQRQNAEQKRQKKEKAERAARAIEEYEKQLKMERKIEVINEKIKKEKSKGLFMDVIIEEKSKKLEELQQKAHKDEVTKAQLRQAVAEECQQKCHFADELNKVEEEKRELKTKLGKMEADLNKVQRQKAKNDAQNAAEIRRLESDLELVQHVTSAIQVQRSHSAIGHFSFTTSTRTISSSEEEEEQSERAVDELAPIGAKNEQFTLEQELSLAQELEKLEEMGQQQQPMDIELNNAALVASEDVKEKENGRQKNGDEKSDKQKLRSATDSDGIDASAMAKSVDDQRQLKEEDGRKLPSATNNAGIDAPALAKSVDDRQQLKEEDGSTADEYGQENQQQEKGEKDTEESNKNLATSEDSGNPFKCSEEKQKQQQMDEGEEKEVEEESDGKIKMPASVDIGNQPKHKLEDDQNQQHTDEGEKEAEEKKENLPTSDDSGNSPKYKSVDDRQQLKEEDGRTADEYGQENQQQEKGEKDTEESNNKMPVPSVAIGIPPKNKLEDDQKQQHTDEGEGKEVEEKKENLPTLEDSVNPLKSSEENLDEGEEKEAEECKDYKGDCEQQGEQMKKTEEKQEEEESDGKMTVQTDEHTPRRRREESEVQQPFVIVHAQMVAQSSAAAAAQEEAGQSKGWCFRCVKKTPNEQQNKSPPYSAAGNK